MDGANRHDMKLVEPTLEAVMGDRPVPQLERPPGLCLDRGYDYPEVKKLVASYGYTAHIRSRGAECKDKQAIPNSPL